MKINSTCITLNVKSIESPCALRIFAVQTCTCITKLNMKLPTSNLRKKMNIDFLKAISNNVINKKTWTVRHYHPCQAQSGVLLKNKQVNNL